MDEHVEGWHCALLLRQPSPSQQINPTDKLIKGNVGLVASTLPPHGLSDRFSCRTVAPGNLVVPVRFTAVPQRQSAAMLQQSLWQQ